MSASSQDQDWPEGRNLKKEISQRDKSKRHKSKSIKTGINAYFKSSQLPEDEDDSEDDIDLLYH